MSPYEKRVRELAYQIWEAEGRPAGHEYRHWEMACKLLEMNDDSLNTRDTRNPLQVVPPNKTGQSSSMPTEKPVKKSATKNKVNTEINASRVVSASK